jgi:hypothetical protein
MRSSAHRCSVHNTDDDFYATIFPSVAAISIVSIIVRSPSDNSTLAVSVAAVACVYIIVRGFIVVHGFNRPPGGDGVRQPDVSDDLRAEIRALREQVARLEQRIFSEGSSSSPSGGPFLAVPSVYGSKPSDVG